MIPKTILIVDDDRDHCDNLEDILLMEGHHVYTAANCSEGRKLAEAVKPDIALLDRKLPDGSGSRLLADIRKDFPGCFCIMASTSADTGSSVSPGEERVFRYLNKPISQDILLTTLSDVSDSIDNDQEKPLSETSLLSRNRELEVVNERLRQIVESTRRLTAFSGSEDIGPVLLHEFAGNMSAQGGSLFLYASDHLVRVHSLDNGHVPETIPFPLKHDSVIHRVLSRNEPVLIENIRCDKATVSSGWKGYSDNSLLAFPLLDKQGGIVGIITLHNKTTPPFTSQDRELGAILASYSSETLRTTQAISDLKQSEENARTILESSPDPVIVFDNDTNVRYINPAFTSIFGWTLKDCSGKQISTFIPDQSLPESDAMRELELNGTSYSGIETVRRSKSGDLIPVSISGAVFRNSSGRPVGSICNLRDITSQKSLEEQLIQSQKMEAIGTLSSGIAHDFNNILSAIFGYVDLAMIDMPEGEPSRKSLQSVMKAANRAKDLVSQILSFSRKSPCISDREHILPHQVVREALVLMKASIPSTIRIIDDIDDIPGSVHINPTQFHQIIMNLCTNAHHAMTGTGGEMTISLRQTGSPHHPDRQMIHLTVSDTGCGMDEPTLKRIFDPYFTTKNKDLGTGLGLSVVRRIINDSNGTISVSSTPGKGTSIDVCFPDAGPPPGKVTGTFPVPGTGSGNILLVDDEKDLVELGSSMLQRLGYSVIAITDPVEALETVKNSSNSFDIVITDMTMPGMTGDRLAAALKKIHPEIPVVLCTGLGMPVLEETDFGTSIDAILRKPVELKDFSETISRFITSE